MKCIIITVRLLKESISRHSTVRPEGTRRVVNCSFFNRIHYRIFNSATIHQVLWTSTCRYFKYSHSKGQIIDAFNVTTSYRLFYTCNRKEITENSTKNIGLSVL